MLQTLRPSLNAYGLPVLTVGLAVFLTLLLQPLMYMGYSLLFLAAVMVSAWYGGLKAGLVATSLAIIALTYFFIAPTYSLWISEPNGVAWLALFVVVSALISWLNEARKRAENRLRDANQELASRVNVLSGLLPVCHHCKKIRDNKGLWKQFETYISEHSDATFSQSICPDCAKAKFPKYPFIEAKSADR